MKSRWRLVYYLLINMVVSSIVAGTVIFFYDRSHSKDCITTLPKAATAVGNGNEKVDIMGVIGAGVITEERLIIQNDGSKDAFLTGWTITDNKGLVFIFPQLMLSPGARVQVHTTSGKDTPTDLYSGGSTPVMTSGELVGLYDSQGNVQAFYRVP
jgi:hypothetical protein